LISVFGILCERAVEYRLQARRSRTRTRLIEGKRIFMQDRVTNIDARLSLKRPRAGQQFVEQDTGRKNVGPLIDAFATEARDPLLRSKALRLQGELRRVTPPTPEPPAA